uniref:ATP synthase subunit a n=1 Tax=Colletes gigas TaxID=935657 RepID=A0A0U1YG67_9HYME|nr:ATP synthase F0 subunit 6 [Colletes gigas]QLI42499.1 ATP synthase F0 subunit 6 [Colletes gigas]
MMTNLFNIFDPSTNMYLSMNWLMMMMVLIFIPFNYWLKMSRYQIMFMLLMKMMFKEFKLLILNKYISNIIIFISLMMMILFMNLLGLFPYNFTSTSHLTVNLSLSLTLWMSFIMFGWSMNMNNMLIHLIPLNTPMFLMNFMVMIELISNIIRPWTLSIRLTANMLAGHLLLSLMGSSMNNMFWMILPLMIIIQNMLFILEISVSMIQSYVFSILSLLYFNESN